MSVKGLILGTNLVSYHCLFLILISIKRVRNPAINGISRYMKTLFAIAPIVICETLSFTGNPNQPGKIAIKT